MVFFIAFIREETSRKEKAHITHKVLQQSLPVSNQAPGGRPAGGGGEGGGLVVIASGQPLCDNMVREVRLQQ